MTKQEKETISPIYSFPRTHEAGEMTDALHTLFAHGKPTRVNVQVLGGNKFCINVDYLDQEQAVIKHVGFADSAAKAMKMAIDEYENPSAMDGAEEEMKKPVYTFTQTGEADKDTFAEFTLHVDGKPTRVLIMVCGKNEFCVCVDNIANAENPHVKHVGIELTLAAAEKLAVSEYEILVSGK